MYLTEETKKDIVDEYNSFKEELYAGKPLEERKKLDQFFTPPSLSITMIERFDCDFLNNKKIIDPTCGSGNLLAACLLAGAQPKNLYGNDYDEDMVNLCYKRLNNICREKGINKVPAENIHRGNALQKVCVNYFQKDYKDLYDYSLIDNDKYGDFESFPNAPKRRKRSEEITLNNIFNKKDIICQVLCSHSDSCEGIIRNQNNQAIYKMIIEFENGLITNMKFMNKDDELVGERKDNSDYNSKCILEDNNVKVDLGKVNGIDKSTQNFLRTLTTLGKHYKANTITFQGCDDKGFKFKDTDFSKYDSCIMSPNLLCGGDLKKIEKAKNTILSQAKSKIDFAILNVQEDKDIFRFDYIL